MSLVLEKLGPKYIPGRYIPGRYQEISLLSWSRDHIMEA